MKEYILELVFKEDPESREYPTVIQKFNTFGEVLESLKSCNVADRIKRGFEEIILSGEFTIGEELGFKNTVKEIAENDNVAPRIRSIRIGG